MIRFFAIVLLCIGAACVYGVLQNQITARVCVEYFTIGHEPVFDTDDPTLLGLGWGVLATWWVGLIMGLVLAAAARLGRRPQRSPGSLIRPIVVLLVIMAMCATAAGVAGYFLGKSKSVTLAPHLAERVPVEKHPRYMACFFAHTASYWVGFVGGGLNVAVVWASRKRIRSRPSLPSKP